jgi:hypothetical protein
MNFVTLKQLFSNGVFQNISKLRVNQSNYPFITLLRNKNGKTEATNVYFGKRTSQFIMDNFNVGDSVIEILKDSVIVRTINANNEVRYKISMNVGNEYESRAELEKAFGEVATDFNYEEFNKLFTKEEPIRIPV